MSNSKNKKAVSFILIIAIILAIVIFALLVYSIINKDTGISNNKTVIDKATGKVVADPELLKIYNMSELDRIKYYLNTYVKHLDAKEYEQAYNMLDPKFKKLYFQTLSSFEQYVKNKYSELLSVSYDDFLRMGNYYIVDMNFLDLFNSTNENMVGNLQKFIIYETDYNQYTIAFQAE